MDATVPAGNNFMSGAAAPATFQYFAYGSNMLSRRMNAPDRAPSARPIATGYVSGRRLTFDKVSRDGSGKCDAQASGIASDRVHGVIFEIALSERAALDAAEGLGNGYVAETVRVVTPSGELEMMTYVATKKESALRPYHWYKSLALAGALEHGLPKDYVEWIRTIDSVEDPNVGRREGNQALLHSR